MAHLTLNFLVYVLVTHNSFSSMDILNVKNIITFNLYMRKMLYIYLWFTVVTYNNKLLKY